MTKTQTAIKNLAEALGYSVKIESRDAQTFITARDDKDVVRISADYIGTRWDHGYTVDRFGYVVHQPTVSALLIWAEEVAA